MLFLSLAPPFVVLRYYDSITPSRDRKMADDQKNTANTTTYNPLPVSNGIMDSQLNEERNGSHAPFVGATLEIGARDVDAPEVKFAGGGLARSDSVPSSGTALTRDRPGSTIGRKSTVSTGSRTAPSQMIYVDDRAKDLFFSKKVGLYIFSKRNPASGHQFL